MSADPRKLVDENRQMLRQWLVLAPKPDPQAVRYFFADRQAGAVVDLNGIANIGAVHDDFRLVRTEDSGFAPSRPAPARRALFLMTLQGIQARLGSSIRYARGSLTQQLQ
jgi:hypothetical protein